MAVETVLWRAAQGLAVAGAALLLCAVLALTWAATVQADAHDGVTPAWSAWLHDNAQRHRQQHGGNVGINNGHPMAPQEPELPCSHPVYCYGDLLHTVQMSMIFTDSKTFVDMPCSKPISEVLAAFERLPKPPTLPELGEFLQANFLEAGSEMLRWEPPDWREDPGTLDGINDPQLVRFARDIHRRWRVLGRRFNRTSNCSDCYSSFDLPHPFVIPGGRFREAYYWDSYWVLDGLLVSNMPHTAKNILDNFVYMVNKYGFVPNGGRIYYTARSQPPVFSLMAKKYYEVVGDKEYLAQLLPVLVKEYNFWMSHRAVELTHDDGTTYTMNIFTVSTNVPRPESYREDLHLAVNMTAEQQQDLFSELASGAETGWDYSSRWFQKKSDLATIRTRSIVPVDLNALLYQTELFLAEASELAGQNDQAAFFRMQADSRRQAIHKFMWDDSSALWRDYNLDTKQQIDGFYISSFVPLWADALTDDQRDEATRERMLQAITARSNNACGMPTSDFQSEQQWDMPNSWPPMQLFVVDALERLDLPRARDLAKNFAQQWLLCNYCGWNATGAENNGGMFEKYDATRLGVPGFGGEYGVQDGFGWTNGVALRLAVQYGSTTALGTCSSVTP